MMESRKKKIEHGDTKAQRKKIEQQNNKAQ
jgi:hypothetical protein